MHWLQSIDTALFHVVNSGSSNPFFDWLMPIASDLPFFGPLALAIAILLLWKGGVRGRLCVLFLILAVGLGDSFVCNPLKHATDRARPFQVLENVRLLVGKGGSASMPSSHAANCFAAAMVAAIFFRRSWRLMLPLALLVSFSRVYNGVHYPSDVLAGAILGAGYAAGLVWTGNLAWQTFGPVWFPLWWQSFPSLLAPPDDAGLAGMAKPRGGPHPSNFTACQFSSPDQHWLRLGYVLIATLFLARLGYVASGKIDLSEDEAYQWLWSKHPALSYFSKPPLIAYVQYLGTHLFGDNAFGIRFFSPLAAAVISLLILRFFHRQTNTRLGVAMILMVTATPLLALGSVLMTVDPLSVLFWTAAMISGWRATQSGGEVKDDVPGRQPSADWRPWLWTGLWMGFGSLSKYTNLFQWICWGLYFLLWPPARTHLRRAGPYLALLINAIFLLPVIIWNAQHGWAAVGHLASDGRLHEVWEPTLRFVWDFLGAEMLLLNPIFFPALIFSIFAFWKCQRTSRLSIFLFCMGAPLFLFYVAFSFHSRVLPNWIAPAVLPLFCLMAVYFARPSPPRSRMMKSWFAVGIGVGIFVVILLHDTSLVQKLAHRSLPPKIDPHHRVHGWRETAAAVETARAHLAAEGPPVFIIADHYGIAGQISFHLPEAKAAVQSGQTFVYFRATVRPENQFFFWPGYENRHGQNAIFVREADDIKVVPGWFWKWVQGEERLQFISGFVPPVPSDLVGRFSSVTDLGIQEIKYRDRVMRRIQLFECRNLR